MCSVVRIGSLVVERRFGERGGAQIFLTAEGEIVRRSFDVLSLSMT